MSHKHNNEPHHNGNERTYEGVLDEALNDMGMAMRAQYPGYDQAPAETPKMTPTTQAQNTGAGEQIASLTGIVSAELTGLDAIRQNLVDIQNTMPAQDHMAALREAA